MFSSQQIVRTPTPASDDDDPLPTPTPLTFRLDQMAQTVPTIQEPIPSPDISFASPDSISLNFTSPEPSKKPKLGSFWSFAKRELFEDDYAHQESSTIDFIFSKKERVVNFLIVPFQVEKLVFFGYFICLDSFLYNFTILPLRIISSLFRLLLWPLCM